jgi:hypothetical protein
VLGLLSNMPYYVLLKEDADGSVVLNTDSAQAQANQNMLLHRAWGWALFGVNSLLTGAALVRIGYALSVSGTPCPYRVRLVRIGYALSESGTCISFLLLGNVDVLSPSGR